MKRLVTLRGKSPNFEAEINLLIRDEICRILDILYLDWNKMDRSYTLAILVQEEEKFIQQNCVVFEKRKLPDLSKDLDDFSEVMGHAKNVPYEIDLVRIFKVTSPRGDRFLAYVIYKD
ncbi:MAG: hypothetical protein GXX09_04395 [Syntrophomonadaceae bacterium]|nr:hypothetical protein [Syntrophomonadaceae bacterium]